MNGFLGILDTPVLTPHLQELIHGVDTLPTIPRCHAGAPTDGSNLRQHAAADPTVASVILKVQALMELIEATGKNCCSETKMDAPLPRDIQSERS